MIKPALVVKTASVKLDMKESYAILALEDKETSTTLDRESTSV